MFLLQLKFEDDLQITRMYSAEGEEVEFRGQKLYPTGNVEDWMLEIEKCMKESLRLIIEDSLQDYLKVSDTELSGIGIYCNLF